MNDAIEIGRQIQAEYSEYRNEDPEAVGLAMLASVRMTSAEYRDHDITVLASAILSRIYDDKGFLGSLASRFSSWVRRKDQDSIFAELESVRRLWRHDNEFNVERDEAAYQRKHTPELRKQLEQIEESNTKAVVAQNEAIVERSRQGIPEEAAGAVALVNAEAKKIMVAKEAETRSQVVIKQTEAKIEKEMIEVRRNDELLRKASDVKHKKKLDKLELKKRKKEIKQDIEASTIFALQNIATGEQLQLRLRSCLNLIEDLKGKTTYAAREERKLLKQYVKDLKVLFHATTGLLQSATQENPPGSNEDSESPGDPR